MKRAIRPVARSGALSLTAILLTLAFALVVHAADYGTPVVFAFLVLMVLFASLRLAIRRTGSGAAIAAYGLFSLMPIFGFGLVNGFWNHLFKLFLFSLHGNELPPLMARLFFTPSFGSPLVETAGILTFLSAMVAAAATLRFVRGEWADMKAEKMNRD